MDPYDLRSESGFWRDSESAAQREERYKHECSLGKIGPFNQQVGAESGLPAEPDGGQQMFPDHQVAAHQALSRSTDASTEPHQDSVQNSSLVTQWLESTLNHSPWLAAELTTSDYRRLAAPGVATTDSDYPLEALDNHWQTFLTILYTLTAVTSFVLNVITVIVLSRSRGSELRKYLINLSLSDLLMSCLSIPFTYTEYMFGRWIFHPSLCPIVRFVVTLSVFTSAATMTVIGINRHLAIMYPFRRKKSSKFRRWIAGKMRVIIGIWLLGIAISLPEYLAFSALPFCYNRQLYYNCRPSEPEYDDSTYTIFIFVSTFAVPLSLLSYLYLRIGFKLWRRQMPGNVDVNRDLTMHTRRVKVIKMLLVVVALFAISWLPIQTFSILMYIYPQLRLSEYQSLHYNLFVGSYFVCHWLSMAHSCLNPLIYCFMNGKFRADLRELVCGPRAAPQAHQAESHSARNLSLGSRYARSSSHRLRSHSESLEDQRRSCGGARPEPPTGGAAGPGSGVAPAAPAGGADRHQAEGPAGPAPESRELPPPAVVVHMAAARNSRLLSACVRVPGGGHARPERAPPRERIDEEGGESDEDGDGECGHEDKIAETDSGADHIGARMRPPPPTGVQVAYV